MMNRSNSLILLVAAIAVAGALLWRGQPFPPAAQAHAPADKEEKRTLTTSGTAVIRVKPDSARVFFRVETVAPDIASARDENAAKVKRVQNALAALKIDNLKMKSDNVHVELVYDRHTPHVLPKILGYKVTHSFTALVTSEDLAKLSDGASKVVDAALASGANSIERVLLFKQDVGEARRAVLTRAVEDALANARALAAGANLTIREPVSIYGQPQYSFDRNQLSNTVQVGGFAGGDEGPTPLVAGELQITCSVNVVCRY